MNSNLLVGKHYIMDPETEDLIYGRELKEGMVVLVESPALRGDSNLLEGHARPEDWWHMLRTCRWAEVTKLSIVSGPNETTTFFIAVYSDGTKHTRQYVDNIGWYVKKDSMPKVEETSVDWSKSAAPTEDSEKVTFEQIGTGRRVTIDKAELEYADEQAQPDNVIGAVTDISEDETGIKVEGTLTDEGMTYIQEDAEASKALLDDDGDNVDDDYEAGPLVQAMRQFEPQLREKRTVTKNEVVEIYGPGRSVFGGPFYNNRRRNW